MILKLDSITFTTNSTITLNKEKEDITKEAAMNIVQEAAMRSVWFMISEKYGKFSLILFYDNEYNNAHGEDL